MKLQKLHPDIYYYTDVFENPKETIRLIEELDKNPESYRVIEPWRNDASERLIKDMAIAQIPNLPDSTKNIVEKIITSIQRDIKQVAEQFYKDKGIDLIPNLSQNLHICRYEEGGRLGLHFDAEFNTAQIYTLAIYWNDDYEGGELKFYIAPDKKKDWTDSKEDLVISIEPAAGSVIIFPSDEPFYHEALEVTSGYKYISTASIFIDGYEYWNPEHIEKYIRKDGRNSWDLTRRV